jgi:hypothetical protein
MKCIIHPRTTLFRIHKVVVHNKNYLALAVPSLLIKKVEKGINIYSKGFTLFSTLLELG